MPRKYRLSRSWRLYYNACIYANGESTWTWKVQVFHIIATDGRVTPEGQEKTNLSASRRSSPSTLELRLRESFFLNVPTKKRGLRTWRPFGPSWRKCTRLS